MFVWDAANVEHIARHGISPEEAEQVLENEPLSLERQLRKGEERTLSLGETATGRVLFIVATPRGSDVRVVTAFPADRQSRTFYVNERRARDAQDPRNS